jgi:A/G-specific adenine glycosylase
VDAIRRAVLDFFRGSSREMPWRGVTDPYRIWISEIMLQQTRVETVRDRYAQFLERYPTVGELAAADQRQVCETWAGLGYYSRARNLQRAAGVIVDRYDAELPSSAADLRALPGIGRYTAGAIASIAFGREEAAVDGNVARVLSRVFELDAAPGTSAGDKRIWALAGELVRGPDPGALNQGLMDLGSTVCLPAAPRCTGCPLRDHCGAYEHGTVHRFPIRRKRQAKRPYEVAFLWAESPRGVWLEKRPVEGLWAGLWQLPGVEGPSGRRKLEKRFEVEVAEVLADVRHQLTHLDVRARVYAANEDLRAPVTHSLRRRRDPLSTPLSALARKAVNAVRGSTLAAAVATLSISGCLYDDLPHGREDRRVVVRAPDVAKFVADSDEAFASPGRLAQTRFTKRKSAAGAYTLTYYYGNEDRHMTIQSTATILAEDSGASAKDVFEAALRNHRAVEDRKRGIRMVPVPVTVGKAEDSRLYLILKDGNPIGNVFAAWRGQVATDMRMTGVYFDEPSSFRRLVGPKFARLSRFDPETSTLEPRRSDQRRTEAEG